MTYDNLYCIKEFKTSEQKVNNRALFEYERLKWNKLFPAIKGNDISDDTITVFVRNLQSLTKHIDHIVGDDRIISNGIMRFTEIQINPSDSTCKIMETSNFFKNSFNNENNFFV